MALDYIDAKFENKELDYIQLIMFKKMNSTVLIDWEYLLRYFNGK